MQPVNGSFAIVQERPLDHLKPEKEIFNVGPIEIPILVKPTRIGSFFSKKVAENAFPLLSASEEVKTENKETKKLFIKHEQEKVAEFDLKMEDGAVINGMTMFTDKRAKVDFKDKKAQDQKWIVRFNGEDVFYEKELLNSQDLGRELNANILVFNYRGIGEGKINPAKPEDVIADGKGCIRYLLSKGVKEDNILTFAHSLGGGIGTLVASLHNQIGLVNVNSFDSFTNAASVSTHTNLTGRFLLSSGWEFDSLGAYEKIKAGKLIVYHKQDEKIPYQKSSLYKMLKEQIKKQNPDAIEQTVHKGKLKDRLKKEYKPLRVKLQKDFGGMSKDAHHYNLQNDEAFPEIQKFVSDFFNC